MALGLFLGQGENKQVKINVSEDKRPSCVYMLRFSLSTYKKMSVSDVVKEVTAYVTSRLKSLRQEFWQKGLGVSDYEVNVAVTSYTVEEMPEYKYVLTTAEGIITIILSPPFGQYALIVAKREGY